MFPESYIKPSISHSENNQFVKNILVSFYIVKEYYNNIEYHILKPNILGEFSPTSY